MLNTPHFLNTCVSSNKPRNMLIFHGSCHNETSTIFSRYFKPIEYYGHPESLLKSFNYTSVDKIIISKIPKYNIKNRQPHMKYFSLSPILNISIFNYHTLQQQQQQLYRQSDLPTLVISYKCNQATISNGVKEIENAQRLFSKYIFCIIYIVLIVCVFLNK